MGHCFALSRLIIKRLQVHSRTFLTSTYKDIEIPRITVAELFFRYVSAYPDNIAYIDDVRDINYTYSDTKRCIHGISSSLTKKGVKVGTMTGIVASNSPEYFMLIMALSSMGCPVTVCNQNYTKTELEYQLTDSKPTIIFTDKDNLEKVTQASSQIPNLQDIYLIGDPLPSYGSVHTLMEDSGNKSSIGRVKIDVDNQVALMPYSSGTTGHPKGVMITHSNLVANMLQMRVAHPLTECGTTILNLPLYHIYATVIITSMAFTSGSTVVVQPRFHSTNFLKAIEKYKANVLFVVPPQVLFLISHSEVSNYDLTSVEQCICAAAPLDAIVERQLTEKFKVHQPNFNVFQAYGLSETSPLTHIVPYSVDVSKKRGSIGLLVPNMNCKIVDVSTREELGPNKQGEILLQGPNIMKGYFGKTSATINSFENGWFLTGDLGHYDEEEYFYVTDRLKELIKVKGFQVAPAEIEGILLSHPAIADCAVIGVPDHNTGEVPRAFVVKSKDVTEDEIHCHISEHLSPHKHLKGGIVFIDEIPKSPSGKILRRLLKGK